MQTERPTPERATPQRISHDRLKVEHPAWDSVPGLVHGVTTRAALPEPGKADFFTVIARARAAGVLPERWTVGADQVHGAAVAAIDRPLDDSLRPAGYRCDEALRACEFPRTDALVTSLPGLLLVIQTADCLPIFLVDADRRVAALAHCGWRGRRGRRRRSPAARAFALGARPRSLQAWLGPCICAENYEVSAAIAEDFAAAFPGAPAAADGRHLDLPAIARWQLLQAGLAPESIIDSGECTLGRPDRYHSYRGAGDEAGRMLSFIGFESPPGGAGTP